MEELGLSFHFLSFDLTTHIWFSLLVSNSTFKPNDLNTVLCSCAYHRAKKMGFSYCRLQIKALLYTAFWMKHLPQNHQELDPGDTMLSFLPVHLFQIQLSLKVFCSQVSLSLNFIKYLQNVELGIVNFTYRDI